MYLGLSTAHLVSDTVRSMKTLDINLSSVSSAIHISYQSVSLASSVYPEAEIIFEDDSNARYTVQTARFPAGAYGSDAEWDITYALNKDGAYIGDVDTAKYICDEMQITPTTASADHKVCSIGKSDKDNKWYGWSHRAMYGFKAGSKVYPGHIAYKADSMEAFKESLKDWYSDDMYTDVVYTTKSNGIEVSYKVQPKDTNRPALSSKFFHEFKPGKGTWTAKNMADAKQMAIDFAESVSSVSAEDIESAETVVSLSVVKQDATKYMWFKYTADKKTVLNKHNRWHDIDLEKGDVVGFRLRASKGDNYAMISKEDTTIVFSMNGKTVQRIVKNCRPYSGKVDGFKVTGGEMDYAKPVAVKEVKTMKGKARVVIEDGVPRKFQQIVDEAVHVAVFQADASRRGYILAVGRSEQAVKKIVTTRSGTNAPAVLMQLTKENGLVKRALKTGWTRLSEQQAQALQKHGINIKQFIPVRKG